MKDQFKSFSSKAGLPPGALIHVGKREPTSTRCDLIKYSKDVIKELRDISVKELRSYAEVETNTWLNVIGLKNVEVISQIGEKYKIHNLVLEDILNTQHRPKIEEFDNYTFFTFKMLRFEKNKRKVLSEQISIVLGDKWIISFQEAEGDTFDPVRKRLDNEIGKIRTGGTDYLLYALIDTVVDNYFSIIDELGINIQKLEDSIIQSPTDDLLNDIQNYKKDLNFIRNVITPLRDSVSFLSKSNAQLISESTRIYFNDTLDHILHLIDQIGEMKENLGTQLELFLSNLSQQMNSVMKVLTIIATIFIPLTFIAGIYGMNFKFMPELEWNLGYPTVLTIMFFILVGMVIYFKRKKWI